MQEQELQNVNKINMITCYLCGRDFGTKGFTFHYKQCLFKIQNELQLMPQHLRTKRITSETQSHNRPKNFPLQSLANCKMSTQKICIEEQSYNTQSKQIYKYQVLPSCKYCGRTFNIESLITHLKGCDQRKSYKQEKENMPDIKYNTPKALVCCVCGQRFGTASLKIHYPECIKKFNYDQFRKHKKESYRKNPPLYSQSDQQLINNKLEWKNDEMEEFNKRATENYRQFAMDQCKNCKRKFFSEQLNKHTKNCVLINGVINNTSKVQDKVIIVRKPKVIVCVICGRDYGLTSIIIHIESCADLFKKQQLLKPKQDRKKLPELSQENKAQYNLQLANEWTCDKLQSYNKIVLQAYNAKSLSKCYICQRTFFEESLPKHLKDCQTKIKDVKKLQKFKKEVQSKKQFFGDNFIENVIDLNRQINQAQFKEIKKPKMLICFLCGRQYGLSSLKIHLPQCKEKKKSINQTLKASSEDVEKRYNIIEAQKWSAEVIEDYNKQAYEIYKKQSLFQCLYCHRTFIEQSLKKHIKHCEKQSKKIKSIHPLRRSQTMKLIVNQRIDQQLQSIQFIPDINKLTHKTESLKEINEVEIEQKQSIDDQQLSSDHQLEETNNNKGKSQPNEDKYNQPNEVKTYYQFQDF